MKTVLTIDFDIIMGPDLGLYNDMVPGRSWDNLLSFDIMKNLKVDFHHYQKLTDFLVRRFKTISKEHIHFIEDHGQIVKYLYADDMYNIINIDHHHDCGYHGNEKENLSCANWLFKISEAHKLNSYTWINNPSSDIGPNDPSQLINNKYLLQDYDLDNMPRFDDLIICLSEPWVPPYVRPLFFTWVDLANNFYNTRFEVDFTRCGEKNENQNKLFLSNKKF